MPYLEKSFQTEFGKWVKHRYDGTAAFELKLARGKSLPFSALEEHQEHALLGASNAQIGYKIPDDGYQHPFDFFTLKEVPAFVVVQFLLEGEKRPKKFWMIDINTWVRERDASERKSLTMERADAIGTLGILE